MNSPSSKYLYFEKEAIKPEAIKNKLIYYDRFISAFNLSPRVNEVFSLVSARLKHWLVFPEYRIDASKIPTDADVSIYMETDECEVIRDFFDKAAINVSERICIDSTGFIRPHLLFMLRYLYEAGFSSVEFLYSEPLAYQKGSGTSFSTNLTEVRQIRSYEGYHPADSDGEYLVVGCGYDTAPMNAVAAHFRHARKIQLFPFPPLRPHMYQENRVRTADCEGAFEHILDPCFAPGYDPFATAQVLSNFVERYRKSIKSLYLSPLATKAQVMGFGWFFLMECLGESVSIVYPFSDGYNQETSTGISEVWVYKMDYDLLKRLRSQF